jgi:hypothetical protein
VSSTAPIQGDETLPAERVLAGVFALLRAGTLVLAATQVLAPAQAATKGTWAAAALGVVAVTSATVLGRAAWRSRPGRARRPLDGWGALAETLAGLAGLLMLARAMPPAQRLESSFWMLPYTVVTAVTLAAACRRRPVLGLIGSLVLASGYGVAVSPALNLRSTRGAGAAATSIDNAISYPGFFVLALVGCRLYLYVAGEVERLRLLACHLPAERARVKAATRAYRIGHDIPKAYLRELRRAERPAAELRGWATRFRSDLLANLSADPRGPVDLEDELTAVVKTFAEAMPLTLDTRGLGRELPGLPALVVAEAVRECLNNASYHAYGSAVTVTASTHDGVVTISVHDSGPGCNPARVMAAWARKQNAVHQVEAAGGAYAVDSGPRGTVVSLSYPLLGRSGLGRKG